MYAVIKSRAFVYAHATKLFQIGLSQYMTTHVFNQNLLAFRESGALRRQAALSNHTENMR